MALTVVSVIGSTYLLLFQSVRQQALKLRSSDYLLNPVEDEELMSAVRKALDELEQEWQEIISIQKINYTLREQLPKLREYLLRDLITGKQDPAIGPLSKKLQMYEVPIARGTSYSMMLLRIDTTEGEYDQSDETLIEYALTNIAAELFGPPYGVMALYRYARIYRLLAVR